MRCSNGALAYGTAGNPQTNISQEIYAAKVAENEAKLKAFASQKDALQSMIDEALVEELERDGVKFNRNDMLFITRDKTNQIVWLEKGNERSGMEHIRLRNHDEQIAKAFGISKDEVEGYLREIISQGNVIRNEFKPVGNRMGYERVYYYEGNYCIITAIGTNGFIISAYPHTYKRRPNGYNQDYE